MVSYPAAEPWGMIPFIIAIGVILRRVGMIDNSLSDNLSRLVATAWGTLFLSFAIAWFSARFVGADRETRGLFASGSTWSNVAIVGYALGEALYGEEGLARASLPLALVAIGGSLEFQKDPAGWTESLELRVSSSF